MSSPSPSPAAGTARHGWPQAVATVLAGLLAMAVVAALGLWASGADDLPDGSFWRVVAATLVTAVGGAVDMSGDAGGLADTDAGLTVMPLSVTLTGALVIAAGFLRPLRHRAVTAARELAEWAGRLVALWLIALVALALAARHTFEVPLGEGAPADIAEMFGVSPRIGFRADVAVTLLFGLLWLAGVLVLALLVAHGAPLPARLLRFATAVRPAAYAMVAVLLVYVALGAVVGLIVAATRGSPAQTFAVLLLGLPNLVWPALTLGLGAAWEGRVEGPFGLPMPRVLDETLRGPGVHTLDVGTLAGHDGRAWWLVVVAAVLVTAAGFLTATRSPAGTPLWRGAVRLAVALALTVLMICLVGRVTAHYGLSVLGIGDLGGDLAGDLFLRPRLWTGVGLALLWGLAAGFLGGLLARPVHRHGETTTAPKP